MQPASTSHTLTVVASRRGQSARLVTSARRRRLEGQAQEARDSIKLRRHQQTSHSLDMIANEWEGTAPPETRGIAAMTTAAAKVPHNLMRLREKHEPGGTGLLMVVSRKLRLLRVLGQGCVHVGLQQAYFPTVKTGQTVKSGTTRWERHVIRPVNFRWLIILSTNNNSNQMQQGKEKSNL